MASNCWSIDVDLSPPPVLTASPKRPERQKERWTAWQVEVKAKVALLHARAVVSRARRRLRAGAASSPAGSRGGLRLSWPASSEMQSRTEPHSALFVSSVSARSRCLLGMACISTKCNATWRGYCGYGMITAFIACRRSTVSKALVASSSENRWVTSLANPCGSCLTRLTDRRRCRVSLTQAP